MSVSERISCRVCNGNFLFVKPRQLAHSYPFLWEIWNFDLDFVLNPYRQFCVGRSYEYRWLKLHTNVATRYKLKLYVILFWFSNHHNRSNCKLIPRTRNKNCYTWLSMSCRFFVSNQADAVGFFWCLNANFAAPSTHSLHSFDATLESFRKRDCKVLSFLFQKCDLHKLMHFQSPSTSDTN